MTSSIQIGKIMGIPIKLHITFLLILPVFAWIFAQNDQRFGFNDVEPVSLRYTLSLSTAILLFASVLLHELGHSYVALKHGSKIQSITLFLFGGVSSMEEIPRTPRTELKMALAGPSVSFFIGIILLVIYSFFNFTRDDPYMRIVWLIGYINLVLFVFNLLPAFPMDGGRVLRAWLAERMSYIKATRAAAGIGKMFAILMGIFGLFVPAGGGIWLILIALFIYIGASEEEKSTAVSVTLEGVKVGDIMTKNVRTVSPETSVEELVNMMFSYKHMGFPVVKDSKLMGIVSFTDVQRVPKEDRINVSVSQIMTKELITLNEQDDAVNALKSMTKNNIGRVVVIEKGNMAGIVSRTDILRSIQLLE